jgi:hypothetical protein
MLAHDVTLCDMLLFVERKNNEKSYSVEEVAKDTGLTVRTLQHDDNIGLMPASGRTEGGHRFYTGSDMLRLSQIVFISLLESVFRISGKNCAE